MAGWSDSTTVATDLLAVVVFTAVAVAVSVSSLGAPLLPLVMLPFLLFVPGYAVVAALFPGQASHAGSANLDGLERGLLSVATSVALAVIVGVNLEYFGFLIRPVPIVVSLSIVSIVAAAVAWYRRLSIDSSSFADDVTPYVSDSSSGSDGSRLASAAVLVAVLVAILSVGAVAIDPPRGERYTEFGLLTATEDGTLEAAGYPSELALGESEKLHFTVTNNEQQSMEYTVVITLVETNAAGETVERARLDTYRDRLAAGDTWRQEHSVTPVLVGERIRLTYLLYTDSPPSEPTVVNSYRDLHVWIDVTENETSFDPA